MNIKLNIIFSLLMRIILIDTFQRDKISIIIIKISSKIKGVDIIYGTATITSLDLRSWTYIFEIIYNGDKKYAKNIIYGNALVLKFNPQKL